jgi:Zn-dependent protease
LHPSWFLVLGLVVWVIGAEYHDLYPRIGATARIVMAVITGVAFFGCLIVHEVSHSLMARRYGIRVRGITLFMFGGVAEIEGEVPTPAREFAVALVGPLTSIALGGVAGVAAFGAHALGWTVGEAVLLTLSLVNLGVALFNLIPGLPLDGGRLLRASMWRVTGDRGRATRLSSGIGVLAGVGLAALGVALAAGGDIFGLWYVPMGAFLVFLARASSRSEPPALPGALALGSHEGQASQPGS